MTNNWWIVSKLADPKAFSDAVIWFTMCHTAIFIGIPILIAVGVTNQLKISEKTRIWLLFVAFAVLALGFVLFGAHFQSKAELPRAVF